MFQKLNTFQRFRNFNLHPVIFWEDSYKRINFILIELNGEATEMEVRLSFVYLSPEIVNEVIKIVNQSKNIHCL